MQILVINSGSTSLKYKLYQTKSLQILKEGEVRNIGPGKVKNHEKALKLVLSSLKIPNIKAVGHRIVHGGSEFVEPTLVNQKILERLKKYNQLAPLHNPANLLGIKASNKLIPNIPDIAVFDTAFFKNLPFEAATYALPANLCQKYHLQRYGFHGLSHQYVAEEAAKKLKKPLGKLKIITCHLGGGSSLTAIKNGQPIETSMGFTPVEGVVMMTRSGNIDPAILPYLMRKEKLSPAEIEEMLNKRSGLKAISGIPSSSMLAILEAAKKGRPKAKLALKLYTYQIKKYIGAYQVILNGLDALVFTGAIGFGSQKIRGMITQDMNILKGVKVLAIETDEELMIAREVLRCYNERYLLK
ncbi:MAG TPA: acetate/propionate family kinase [Candidatus Portnoybacteria bacterium]|nr:acetate/propionate family kinase [Candidatus Portnoybacteria bacterium]